MIFGIESRIDKNCNYHTIFMKYAHGELEKILKNDILLTDDYSDIRLLESVEDKEVFAIDVTLPNKEIAKCKAFIWRASAFPHTKGLIVLEDDLEGIKYATNHYNNKSIVI